MENENDLPEELKNQLIENSSNGYVLFITDGNGDIRVYKHYDNEAAALLFILKAKNWAYASEKISKMHELEEMIEIEFLDEDGEEEEDA